MRLSLVGFILLISVLLVLCSAFEGPIPYDNLNKSRCDDEMSWSTPKYPDSLQHPELTKTTDYHGVQVVDKFAWLEDPRSDDVKTWVDAQNALTESYLNQLDFKSKMTARYAFALVAFLNRRFEGFKGRSGVFVGH